MSPAEFGVNEFESLSQDGPNCRHVNEHYRNSHQSVNHGHNLAHRSFRDKVSISWRHLFTCNLDDHVTDGGGHRHAVHQAGTECPHPGPGLPACPALPDHLHCGVLQTGDRYQTPAIYVFLYLSVAHSLITMEVLCRQLSWDVKSLFCLTVSFHISLDAFALA